MLLTTETKFLSYAWIVNLYNIIFIQQKILNNFEDYRISVCSILQRKKKNYSNWLILSHLDFKNTRFWGQTD